MDSLILVNGCKGSLWMDPGGWVVASVPVPGNTVDLLSRQSDILGLAKIVKGPEVRVDLFWGRKSEERRRLLETELEVGLEVLLGSRGDAGHRKEGEGEERIERAFESSLWAWRRDGKGFLIENVSSCPVVKARAMGRCASFSADLTRLHRSLPPVCLQALAHFLIQLNSRLRLARGSLYEEKVCLEVFLPVEHSSSSLVDRAVGSLAVGARFSRRECAALLDPEVAKTYLEFHRKGGDLYERPELPCGRLEQVA